MNLNPLIVVEVLRDLIGGEIKSTPLGDGLAVDSREAFLFSALTGATYFDNQIFPYTPKGLLKVFHNALQYKVVTGIFDNGSLKNTPLYITDHKKFLLTEHKVIVPVEIRSEKHFREILAAAYGVEGSDPNIVILKLDLSKKGMGLESFMEYLACKYFNGQGFITENQIPLSHSLGSPDFSGVAISQIQDAVVAGGVLQRGFSVIEVAMIRAFPMRIRKESLVPQLEFLVGEAKTSTSVMEKQIRKYLSSGFFDGALEIHPTKKVASKPDIGLLTLNASRVQYAKPTTASNFRNVSENKKYRNWLESYFNCYLIANYRNDELNSLGKKMLGKTIDSMEDLICLIRDFRFDEHLTTLKGFISNGTIK